MATDWNREYQRLIQMGMEIPAAQETIRQRKAAEEQMQRGQQALSQAEAARQAQTSAAQEAEDIRKRFQGFQQAPIQSLAGTGPAEMQDILKRAQEGLAGYNAPQLAALQAQMAGGQQSAQQQRERALQGVLARQGIRGGAAASLQAQAGQQAAREKATMDTEMLMKQAQKQEQALGTYASAVQGSLQAEEARRFQQQALNLAAEQQVAAAEAARRQAEATTKYGESMERASEKKGKIICTELYEQGLMSREVYLADQEFGQNLTLNDPEVMIGYHAWARPITRLMRKSALFTRVVFHIATPWAKQMAYELGVIERPNFIGSILMKCGLPLCRMIGKLARRKAVQHG